MAASRGRAPSEHQLQAAFFELLSKFPSRPELKLCFAIPNGGQRHKAVAGKLKAEGVKAGVPDVFCAIPRPPYAGLFLEFKKPGEKPSDRQRAWISALRGAGYRVELVYGPEHAWQILRDYLGGNLK